MTHSLKIAIVGPESTGKSTLVSALAQHYGTTWVPEVARTYLDNLERDYRRTDLRKIAELQVKAEEDAALKGDRIFFCDTNLLVIKIWSEVKYGTCDSWILENMNLPGYALHFLTGTDVPWEFDPQREHPHFRDELYEMYKDHLARAGVDFVELSGSASQRLSRAIAEISKRFDVLSD